MAKIQTRKGPQMGAGGGGQQSGPQSAASASAQNAQGMTPGPLRHPSFAPGGPQLVHHHQTHGPSVGNEAVGNAVNGITY